jgi:hypothetical protein
MAKRYTAKEGLLHHGVWRELDADGNVTATHGKLPIPAGTHFEVDDDVQGRHKKLVVPFYKGGKKDEPGPPVEPGPDEIDPGKNGGPVKRKAKR